MEKWEYKAINVESKGSGDGTSDINNFTMVINQLGSVGWELVSCLTTNQEQGNTQAIFAILKRKISSRENADQPSNTPERPHAYPEKGPRTYGDKPRTFGKSPAYGENRGPRPSKPPYSGDKRTSSGFKGKSSGGYKGKGPGNAGKGSWK